MLNGKKKKPLFMMSDSYWAIFWLFLQQLLVASSTLFISDLGSRVVDGQSLSLYVGLFAGSLFLVYVPGILSAWKFEKAKNQALINYTENFAENYRDNPQLVGDKKAKEDIEPWVTSEGKQTLEEGYSIGYDSTSIGLNCSLNVGALCYSIDPRLAGGYGLSFLSILGVSYCLKDRLANISEAVQNSRKNYSQSLLPSWDNIITGNSYNFQIWLKRVRTRWNEFNVTTVKNILFSHYSSTGAMFLALVPAAGFFTWVFLEANDSDTKDRGKLGSLIVTIPRQIQIIQNLQAFSGYAMSWHGLRAKLKQLYNTMGNRTPYDRNGIVERIQFDKLEFFSQDKRIEFANIKAFMEHVTSKKFTGRIVLRGPNGSGKTTLMGLVKKEMGEQAFYMPPKSNLMFESTVEESLSTGLDFKASLLEMMSQIKAFGGGNQANEFCRVFILDEWQANLDQENFKEITSLLDEIAMRRGIIEISHVPKVELSKNKDISKEKKTQQEANENLLSRVKSFNSSTIVMDLQEGNRSPSNLLYYYSNKQTPQTSENDHDPLLDRKDHEVSVQANR